uniref:glutathione transferase n=1 Tax=Rhinolophus ferrumequinum TaxID=59479 RepID=A0A671FNU5_RHIFE
MAVILGYWDIRRLADAIRLLLEYTASTYEEKYRYVGDAPGCDRSQWLSDKFTLGLDFPNLPYLLDGARWLTKSNVVLCYIARDDNLCGETEEEKSHEDILEKEVMDSSNQLARVCSSPDFEKLKPEFLKALPEKTKFFAQFLGKRSWFAGGKPASQTCMFEPKCLEAFPNLKAFVAGFQDLKKMSASMKSSYFLPSHVLVLVWGAGPAHAAWTLPRRG